MINRLLGKQKNQDSLVERVQQLQQKPLPKHIAVIMDGNGRWARRRALPRMAGHHEGMNTVKKITRIASNLGIGALTMYAFSTENWKRPKKEVDFLMKLPSEFLHTFLPELIEQNVKVEMIGDPSHLPQHTLDAIHNAMEETKHNDGLILNFAMNYGSRAEIVQATKQIAELVQNGQLSVDDITDETVNAQLMTAHLDEPDLLIRTSGEVRLSNFMLWQLAYAEFIFTDVLWPDFTEHHFLDAVEQYQSRHRRFGSVEGEQKA